MTIQILITGGSGMVGSNIKNVLNPLSTELDITNFESISKYFNSFDSDFNDISLKTKRSKISAIIHLAALNLRECENNSNNALNININGTLNMITIAKKYNIPFIFVSTGAVFSSEFENMQFNEISSKNPKCIYGHTKSSGEECTLLYEKGLVVRTGWLFGGNQKKHYKFVENVINNLLTNNIVRASGNFYGSPTYVKDFINILMDITANADEIICSSDNSVVSKRIFHITNRGSANGFEIASQIADYLSQNNYGVNINNIINVSSLEVPNSGPYRGKSEILSTIYKQYELRRWTDALREYVNEYIGNISPDNSALLQRANIDTSVNSYPINNSSNNHNNNKLWKIRDICRLCNSGNIHNFLELEPTPPANNFVKNRKYQDKIPLDLCICFNCNHVQLREIVEPSILYSNYLYVSSTSPSMTKHLQDNVEFFCDYVKADKTDNILEIGANDGTCVKYLIDAGYSNVVGIDPAQNINKFHNLPIICDYFGSNIVPKLKSEYGLFRLIYAFHCCAHIENIQDVFASVKELLDDNGGIFVMEVGYFYDVYTKNNFDTIYHEHIDYHTCTAMKNYCDNNDLIIQNVRTTNIQGGSIQFYIGKKLQQNQHILIDLDNNSSNSNDNNICDMIEKEKIAGLFDYNNLLRWKNTILFIKRNVINFLRGAKLSGLKIAGYGASAKSTTLLHEFKISNSIIDFIIDDNKLKHNYYTPGTNIPINSIDILDITKIDYIVILSCNFTTEIIKKLEKYRANGLQIILPFPKFNII